jgi:hypothetical protein
LGNEAWFEDHAVTVEGFAKADCPHGELVYVMDNSLTDRTYACTRCEEQFIVRIRLEE